MIALARRIQRLEPSPIRDILHVITQPGMISFAGGLPSTESFPAVELGSVPAEQLQYGASEGDREMRERIAVDLTRRGLPTDPEHVLVLSGSQQGIDLVGKLLVDSGTRVAVESPTYLAALQVFSLLGADYTSFVPGDTAAISRGKPRLTYAIPTFQNPTGHCYSTEERHALAGACDESGSVLFEDDPYRDLAYDDCDRTPVCSLVKKSHWIYQSSFSKTLAPGLRLGYLTCSPDIYPYLVQLKQAADLHSNRLSQYLVMQLLQADDTGSRLTDALAHYRNKRDHFDALLRQYFDDIADWQMPSGGLFFWLKLKLGKPVDSRSLLSDAISRKVAFMPGEPFFPNRQGPANAIRLNFSHASGNETERGLQVLSAMLNEAGG